MGELSIYCYIWRVVLITPDVFISELCQKDSRFKIQDSNLLKPNGSNPFFITKSFLMCVLLFLLFLFKIISSMFLCISVVFML